MVKILELLWWLNLTKSGAASHIKTYNLTSVSDTDCPHITWLFKARACSWAWASGISGWILKIVVTGLDCCDWSGLLWLVQILIGQHSDLFHDVSHAETSMGAQEDFIEYEMRSVLFWELRWHRMVVCWTMLRWHRMVVCWTMLRWHRMVVCWTMLRWHRMVVCWTMFQDNVSVPQDCLTLKDEARTACLLRMGLIGCPETSVTNYHSVRRKIPKESFSFTPWWKCEITHEWEMLFIPGSSTAGHQQSRSRV